MNKFKQYAISVIMSIIALLIFSSSGCRKDDIEDTISDAQAVEALRDVSFSYDSTAIEFVFPDGVFSSKTLEELMQEDPETYANPANYSIHFNVFMLADNSKENARDAKFDGMRIKMAFDTIESNPVMAYCESFEIDKGDTKPVISASSINLETHKLVGRYIFEQTVEGDDITTRFYPTLFYKIGLLQGEINIPSFVINIPTRASEETKAFLAELLESALMEIQ